MGARLEDVDDVEDFVRWQVNRSISMFGLNRSPTEIEDVVGEGIVLMYEIHQTWDPTRCERFSALALSLLGRRLISWHRKDLRQSGRGSWNGSKGTYTHRDLVSLDSLEVTDTAADRSLVISGLDD